MQKKAQILKCAGDPLFGNGIRREPIQALSFKMNLSVVRLVNT